MSWEPISSDNLWDLINEACVRMDAQQARLWETIRITPEKWQQHPWGDEGGGFWVAGIIGETVVWYNDIEDGFNRSRYTRYGTINDYWCNQDELEHSVQQIMNMIANGYDSGPYFGPPQPGPFPG
jgi:hypothetical protein